MFGLCLGLFLNAETRGDWPGLLGPQRDGHAAPGTRVSQTVANDLKPAWELPAGQGYAGAAIRGQQAVLYQRDGGEDILRLVDLADGRVQWRTAFPATYRQGIDEDKGPRSVPQIADDCAVIQSASGSIHCVALADGKVRWSRDLRKEFGAEDGYFGAGNTPLVSGVLVIVNVGAKKQRAGIVAISLLDGKTFWTATDADAGYASPIMHSHEGTDASESKTAIVPTRLTTYGIDPMTGQVRWEFPFGQRGPTVNAATPILLNNGHLLQTSSYGIGYISAEFATDRINVVRKGDELASQYATPVAVGDYVFGSDGREDFGGGSYKCLQPDTGKIVWEEIGMPICHTIAIDSENQPQLLIFGIDGRLWLTPAGDRGFKPIWQSRLPMGKYRALPALSGNRLLVRTSLAADSKWMCFEL
jgi:outer membrane protein assembly factor BamB